MIMSYDINVNQRCFRRKTALYYAIRSQNIQIIKKLLQSGAVPWSTPNCQYGRMIANSGSNKMQTLFKNAKKVAIAVQLRPTKPKKVEMWNAVKHLISENYITDL